MLPKNLPPVVAAGLVCLSLAAVPAQAEWFGDVSLGTALTGSSDLTTVDPGGKGEGNQVFTEVDFDTSFTLGGRVGYWSEDIRAFGLDFGSAAGLFRFSPDITSQVVPVNGVAKLIKTTEIDVTALSFDVMTRMPLMINKKYPKGRLRPYVTLGPTIFFSTIKDQGNIKERTSDTDVSGGLKFGFGSAWQIRENVDLFGEYRFTHFGLDAKMEDPGGTVTAETDINTNHLVVGISFRF